MLMITDVQAAARVRSWVDRLRRYELIALALIVSLQWLALLYEAPGIYAISVSLLPSHFFAPKYRRYYEYFRNSKPGAIVAESIYIYQVK